MARARSSGVERCLTSESRMGAINKSRAVISTKFNHALRNHNEIELRRLEDKCFAPIHVICHATTDESRTKDVLQEAYNLPYP